MFKTPIVVYVDGGSLRNGKENSPAACGCLFLRHNDQDRNILNHWRIVGKHFVGTNNVAELTAAIIALENLKLDQLKKKETQVTIVSDSQYVVRGITEWIPNWRRNGWHTAEGKDVMNRQLWEKLYGLNCKIVKWHHVRGHNEHLGNEIADFICSACSRLTTDFDMRSGDIAGLNTLEDIKQHLCKTLPMIKKVWYSNAHKKKI